MNAESILPVDVFLVILASLWLILVIGNIWNYFYLTREQRKLVRATKQLRLAFLMSALLLSTTVYYGVLTGAWIHGIVAYLIGVVIISLGMGIWRFREVGRLKGVLPSPSWIWIRTEILLSLLFVMIILYVGLPVLVCMWGKEDGQWPKSKAHHPSCTVIVESK